MEVRLYYRKLPVNSTLGRIAPGPHCSCPHRWWPTLTFDFRHLENTNSRATIQMRGSTSNCQSGRQSNRKARIMKTMRTDLKRKRCPMAVIKSTVARSTVMRTYWSPVSPDFVPSVGHLHSLLIQTKELLVLGVVILGHEDRARRRLRVLEWIGAHPGCECGSVLVSKAPLKELRGLFLDHRAWRRANY